MSRLSYFLCSFFIIIFTSCAFSQSDEQVITKFVNKQKEIADKSKIKTLYQEFKVSMMGMEIPNKIWMKGDNIRFETSFMGQNQTFIVTKDAGWQIQNGTTTDLPTEQLEGIKKQIINQTLAGSINFNDEELGREKNKYELLGLEKINNLSCHKLKITPKDTTETGNEGTFWFDTKDFLIRKISFKEKSMGQEQNIDILVKDYQQVGGFTFPKVVEMNVGEGQDVKIEFNTVKVNEPIDDSLFKK
ncbi:MAG: outer membrane lipoprotein-sorting protein [Ignavibacteria bacterium]|nr:outer membrane lipoprotein-sorting protein [Ignavibacteria bacterium]